MMSKNKHNELWSVNNWAEIVNSGNGRLNQYLGKFEKMEHADRAAACVNACAWMEDPVAGIAALREIANKYNAKRLEYIKLRATNGRLQEVADVAAAAMKFIREKHAIPDDQEMDCPYFRAIESALAGLEASK
jgi:hypothetical protein